MSRVSTSLFWKSVPKGTAQAKTLPICIHQRSYRALGQPLLGRYQVLPVELFRIGASEKVILRDFEAKMNKGRSSLDVKLAEDGLVHPKPGDTFEGKLPLSSVYMMAKQRTQWYLRVL